MCRSELEDACAASGAWPAVCDRCLAAPFVVMYCQHAYNHAHQVLRLGGPTANLWMHYALHWLMHSMQIRSVLISSIVSRAVLLKTMFPRPLCVSLCDRRPSRKIG